MIVLSVGKVYLIISLFIGFFIGGTWWEKDHRESVLPYALTAIQIVLAGIGWVLM